MDKLENIPKTIICDIDGTLIEHVSEYFSQNEFPKFLPLAKENLDNWNRKGYYIILITGRKENNRVATEKQLFKLGISYDLLIMGVSRGQRVLINDLKPGNNTPTALAINLNRNEGFKKII